MISYSFCLQIFLFLDQVRHTLDVMKFYEKTEFHIIYMTTHDAVICATNALNNGSI